MSYVQMKWRSDGKSSANQLYTYITDAEKTNGVVVAKNLTSLDTAVAEMEATIANSRSTNKAIRHIIVSQPPGEDPTPEQFGKMAEITMNAMGMDSRFHQYVYAVHYDTDNAHMHIMVNHVNPITLRAVNEQPMIEKIKSDIAERRIEQEFGFSPNPAGMIKAIPDTESEKGYQLVPDTDNAPYIKAYYNEDGLIDREKGTHGFYCDHKEMARFLEEKDEQALGRTEREMIYQRAERPFTEYLKEEVRPALESTLKNDSATWKDIHHTLREYNVVLAEVDRGLRVYDLAESTYEDADDVLSHNSDLHKNYAKASDISYKFSKKKLEDILGPYQPPEDLSVNSDGERYDKDQVPKALESSIPKSGPDHNIKENLRYAWRRFKAEKNDWYSNTKSIKSDTQKQRRKLYKEVEKLYNQRDFEIKKYIDVAKQENNWKLIDDIRLEYLAKIQLAKHHYKEAMNSVRSENREKMKNDISGNAKFPNASVYFQHHADKGERWAQDVIRCMKASNQYEDSIHQPADKHKNEAFDVTASKDDEAKTFENLQVRFDQESHNNIYYRDDQDVFTDHGTRFSVHEKDQDNIAAALILAADKFGGSVIVHGDEQYRRMCLEIAEKHDITITNAHEWDFYEDEREKHSLQKEEIDSETPDQESHHSAFSGDEPEDQKQPDQDNTDVGEEESLKTQDTFTQEDLNKINNETAEKWTPELIDQAEREGYDLTQDSDYINQITEETLSDDMSDDQIEEYSLETIDPQYWPQEYFQHVHQSEDGELPKLHDEFVKYAENKNITIEVDPENNYVFTDQEGNEIPAFDDWRTEQLSNQLDQQMLDAKDQGFIIHRDEEMSRYQVIDQNGEIGYFRVTEDGQIDQSVPDELPESFKEAIEQQEQARLAEASAQESEHHENTEEEGPNGPLPFENKMKDFGEKGLAEQLDQHLSGDDDIQDYDLDEGGYVDESDQVENESYEPVEEDDAPEEDQYEPPPPPPPLYDDDEPSM